MVKLEVEANPYITDKKQKLLTSIFIEKTYSKLFGQYLIRSYTGLMYQHQTRTVIYISHNQTKTTCKNHTFQNQTNIPSAGTRRCNIKTVTKLEQNPFDSINQVIGYVCTTPQAHPSVL